jgi:hypothetical protein
MMTDRLKILERPPSASTPTPGNQPKATIQRVLRLILLIGVAWIPVLIGRGVIQSVSSLHAYAASGHPYFVPEHALALYFWSPLVVASACIFLLTPGLLLALALNRGQSVGNWVLYGFALSIAVDSAAAGVVQTLVDGPLLGATFAAVIVICSIVSLAILLIRLARGHSLDWPLAKRYAGATVASMIVVPMLILISLTPKFYWENFNGDGAHAFESMRLLLFQPVPFWPHSAGEMSGFPGITSMLFIFPGSWFIRLFGEIEASARLPHLLYLAVLFSVILAIVERFRRKVVGPIEQWLIWLGLTVYTVAVAFSATYNPYAADIAIPAAQDTLLMACFLGFILAFLERTRLWMYFFIVLTYVSLPSGTQLIGLWVLAVVLVWRPRPWRQAGQVVAALAVCFIVAAILPRFLIALHLPPPGWEYNAATVLKHFAWLQFTDVRRFLFMIVPCGVLPAAALFAWRSQNRVARALTLVTAAYFLFFYVTAHIVLHYFIPVMILPLVVFWQNDLLTVQKLRPIILGLTGVAGIIALILSLPSDATPDTSARTVGSAIRENIGGYDVVKPEVFRSSEILYELFPVDWDPRVPFESYGGSDLTWNFYAHHSENAADKINYIVQRESEPPPAGTRLIAQKDGVTLYVLSDSAWQSHIALRPPTPAGSRVYSIPRGLIFRSVPLEGGPPIIDMIKVLEALGIDLDPILDRLGVSR